MKGQFPVFYGIPPEIPKGDNINHKLVPKWPARASYISQRKVARSRLNFNKRGAK